MNLLTWVYMTFQTFSYVTPKLTVIVYPNQVDYRKTSSASGLRVYMHKENEVLDPSEGINIGDHTEALISLESKEEQACSGSKKSEDLYLSNRESCMMKCKAKELNEICGCLPYFLSEMGMNGNITVNCDYLGLKCIAENYGKCLTIIST